MTNELMILIVEAMSVYFLVLWAHSLRSRFGLAHFYALIGGLTAIMSWVTDAGVKVEVAGITFMVGSTVFYTSLLLAVFVVYVFDGPRATRIAISTVAGVSAMVPLIAVALHFQMKLAGHSELGFVPTPSLRINAASVLATVADLVFLGMAWEFLGKPKLRLQLWLRAYLTLLGVMWLDVFLFATGAFIGAPDYLGIMKGTLLTRLIVSAFACPFLYLYLEWQNKVKGIIIENRPVLSILKEVAEVRLELSLAQQEIERRKKAEREKEELIRKLEKTIARVKRLEGLLPVCSGCKRIRLDAEDPDTPPRWVTLEEYVRDETTVTFSHGMCIECARRMFPEISEEDLADAERRSRGRWRKT
ncbi:hypothetical protein GX586_02590 [bacterium]|nr:hypothetical protein [bacterium]